MTISPEDPILLKFPATTKQRKVYFDSLDQDLALHLKARGYIPILLMEMPRETEEDAREYLLALAQGMAEETVLVSKERLQACELEMKARKMLTAKELPPNKPKVHEEIEDILDSWTTSRHAQARELHSQQEVPPKVEAPASEDEKPKKPKLLHTRKIED